MVDLLGEECVESEFRTKPGQENESASLPFLNKASNRRKESAKSISSLRKAL